MHYYWNGHPPENPRRQHLAQSQVAHIANLASEACRHRNLAQSQVTHVANVASAHAEDRDDHIRFASEELAVAQQEHEWREQSQQHIIRITAEAQQQQLNGRNVARRLERQMHVECEEVANDMNGLTTEIREVDAGRARQYYALRAPRAASMISMHACS